MGNEASMARANVPLLEVQSRTNCKIPQRSQVIWLNIKTERMLGQRGHHQHQSIGPALGTVSLEIIKQILWLYTLLLVDYDYDLEAFICLFVLCKNWKRWSTATAISRSKTKKANRTEEKE